jgi:hypothetical protein
MHINRHVARTACVCARRAGAAACGGGRIGATVAFFHDGSTLISRGNRRCRGKIVVTPATACSRERALLAHVRLREQGTQGVLGTGAGTQEEVRAAVRADSVTGQAQASGC